MTTLQYQLTAIKRTAILATAYTVVLSFLGRIWTRKSGVSALYCLGEFKVGCHVTLSLYVRYIRQTNVFVNENGLPSHLAVKMGDLPQVNTTYIQSLISRYFRKENLVSHKHARDMTNQ